MGISKQKLFVIVVLICSANVIAKEKTKKVLCDAPEYFGICDPFVPGTLIGGTDRKPMYVSNTWPGGPADRAGICAGDEILTVNGLLCSENTFRRMLRELVSDSATSVLLKILRGKQELEFTVPRVRESTLAYLSNQKFLRRQLVPLAQTAEGIEEVEKFRERVMAAVGYKKAGTKWVPINTPESQARRFAELLENAANSERLPGASFAPVTTRMFGSREGCSAGFTAVILKAPDEVWIRNVIPQSPAHKGGLFPGDQLIELDGRAVRGMTKEELDNLILRPDIPRSLRLTVKRGRRVLKLVIKTEKLQDFVNESIYPQTLPSKGPSVGTDLILGVGLIHSENPSEAIVESVSYPSPAFHAGLLVGDKLLRVNRVPLESIAREQLERLLAPTQPSDIGLDVVRAERELTFRITPITYEKALAQIDRTLTRFGSAPPHCSEPHE